MKKALITGSGGFIGWHLSRFLVAKGYSVAGVDIKRPEFGDTAHFAHFELADLRDAGALGYVRWKLHQLDWGDPDEIYHLAADMGGIGFITAHLADVARNNTLIDINVLDWAVLVEAKRCFWASSACIYPAYAQGVDLTAKDGQAPLNDLAFDSKVMKVEGLTEYMAYPAEPERGYGLQKLFGEALCEYYREDRGLETRVARFHNIGGPNGTFEGGREKAPAALCRKVALAPDGGEIEIWGDGQQSRSFCYVGDLVEGIYRLAQLEKDPGPVNLGSDRMVTIDELADIVIAASGKKLMKKHVPGPQGVYTRNSNGELARKVLGGWEPTTLLETWIKETYDWIAQQLEERKNAKASGS